MRPRRFVSPALDQFATTTYSSEKPIASHLHLLTKPKANKMRNLQCNYTNPYAEYFASITY